MDVSQMNVDELRKIIKAAEAEIEKRRKIDKKATIQEIRRLAQERGYTLDELLGAQASTAKREPREREIKFRHPEDPSKTWTGMGRKPGWVQEWIQSGRDIQELRVQ